MSTEADQPVFISAGSARRRYGNLSTTSFWRWERDETLGFPRPILISGRKFFKLRELEAWEARLPDVSAIKPPKRRSRDKGEAATDKASATKQAASAQPSSKREV